MFGPSGLTMSRPLLLTGMAPNGPTQRIFSLDLEPSCKAYPLSAERLGQSEGGGTKLSQFAIDVTNTLERVAEELLMEDVLRRWFLSLLPVALSTSSTGGMRCQHLRIASEGNHGIVRPDRQAFPALREAVYRGGLAGFHVILWEERPAQRGPNT